MGAIQQLISAIGSTSYASLNPDDSMTGLVLSEGNLKVTRSGGTTWGTIRATVGKSSGKFVFEVTTPATNNYSMKGICTNSYALNGSTPVNSYLGQVGFTASVAWGDLNNTFYTSGSPMTLSNSIKPTQYSTHMIAVDATYRKAWIKSSQDSGWASGGDPASGTTPTWTWSSALTIYPAVSLYTINTYVTCNFGATPFVNTVPTGFTGWKI